MTPEEHKVIWTVEEATWILTNASRPEGVLMGINLPESRLRYLESLYCVFAINFKFIIGINRLVNTINLNNWGCLFQFS
jgi:hypothetical protein